MHFWKVYSASILIPANAVWFNFYSSILLGRNIKPQKFNSKHILILITFPELEWNCTSFVQSPCTKRKYTLLSSRVLKTEGSRWREGLRHNHHWVGPKWAKPHFEISWNLKNMRLWLTQMGLWRTPYFFSSPLGHQSLGFEFLFVETVSTSLCHNIISNCTVQKCCLLA